MADETAPEVEAAPVVKTETPINVSIEPGSPDEPKQFDESYVKQLRSEAAKHRIEAKEANVKVQAFEDAQKSDDEKRVEALEAERKRAETAESRIQELEVKQLRSEVAAEKKLPPKLAGRLTGETREEIVADADALLEDLGTLPGETPPPGDGGARTPVQPKDLEAQIREAEAEGDYRKSMSLKSQQLVAMKAR